MKLSFDRVFFVTVLVASFYGGMKYKEYSISHDTLQKEHQEQVIKEQREKAADEVAQKVIDNLSQWEQNKEVIVKEYYHEKTNTVFDNRCATDNYVSLFNKRQQEARRVLSDKP